MEVFPLKSLFWVFFKSALTWNSLELTFSCPWVCLIISLVVLCQLPIGFLTAYIGDTGENWGCRSSLRGKPRVGRRPHSRRDLLPTVNCSWHFSKPVTFTKAYGISFTYREILGVCCVCFSVWPEVTWMGTFPVRTICLKHNCKQGIVVLACYPSTWGLRQDFGLKASLSYIMRPCFKTETTTYTHIHEDLRNKHFLSTLMVGLLCLFMCWNCLQKCHWLIAEWSP